MARGEYVSLGKVESALKGCPYVSNICVVVNSLFNYTTALVVPSKEKLEADHPALGAGSLEDIATREEVKAFLLKEVRACLK